MAIEDHPQFSDWAEALDRLKNAKDALQTAVAFGELPEIVKKLREEVIFAQVYFNDMSDQIDNG